jgi:ABC-2 type transport system permease protein
MSKIWLIARHHFLQEATKRSFLLVLFSLPLFLLLSMGLGYMASEAEKGVATLGYVDQPGVLTSVTAESEDGDIRLVAFDAAADARDALDAGQIDAYYVLSPDYAVTRQTELFYYSYPAYSALRTFEDSLRHNLLAGQPPAVTQRVLDGPHLTVHATDTGRDYPSSGPTSGQTLPLIIAVMFAFLVLTTGGYLMEVVVAEKENRTIEIVISSVSTMQMMTGKILGAVGIALMQLAVWVGCLLGAIWIGGSVLEMAWLQTVTPNWGDILVVVIVALPTYLCLAALMTMLGSTLVDSQEAQQIGPFFFLLLLLPVYVLVPIATNPNGTLALIFTLAPFTSIVTMGLRSLFAVVPAWQAAAATAVNLGLAAVLIWLAAKAFRLSMLRYGQRLRLRELFARNNGAAKPASPAQPGLAQ